MNRLLRSARRSHLADAGQLRRHCLATVRKEGAMNKTLGLILNRAWAARTWVAE